MSVRVEPDGPVFTVVLHRPEKRNAVDGKTADALAEAFRAFEADDTAHVAVLYGDGGTFCAGADLKSLGGKEQNRIQPDGDGPMGPTRMLLRKPVIAAIEGYAVAGGIELAAWCDLRVASTAARFGVLCRRFGVPLIDGGTIRLPRLIGLSHALDLIMTGRLIEAEEAFRIGLVNRLCPPGQARAHAEKLAHELARLPQTCLREDRLSAYEQSSLSLDAALANEFEHGARSLSSPEMMENVGRFIGGAGRGGTSA